jgi:hypothetical protein
MASQKKKLRSLSGRGKGDVISQKDLYIDTYPVVAVTNPFADSRSSSRNKITAWRKSPRNVTPMVSTNRIPAVRKESDRVDKCDINPSHSVMKPLPVRHSSATTKNNVWRRSPRNHQLLHYHDVGSSSNNVSDNDDDYVMSDADDKVRHLLSCSIVDVCLNYCISNRDLTDYRLALLK